jgi:hypothetical protein
MNIREHLYRRKRDGRVVTAADWDDGDVSWALHPIPVVAFTRVAGTCSREHFEANHDMVVDRRPAPVNEEKQER